MDRDELAGQLHTIFEPEPDEDGFIPETPPHERLADVHKPDRQSGRKQLALQRVPERAEAAGYSGASCICAAEALGLRSSYTARTLGAWFYFCACDRFVTVAKPHHGSLENQAF